MSSPDRLLAHRTRTACSPSRIPRALVQALRIEKGETLEWVIEDGEIVLKRLGMLKK